MKLKFLGVLRPVTRTSGCSSCGNRTSTVNGYQRKTSKTIFLPSGVEFNVRVGQTIDVSDEDGLYLADLTYQINNQIFHEFEVI